MPPTTVDAAPHGTIEVVRGDVDEARSESLVRFWVDAGVLDEAAARQRVAQVLCVLIDPSGDVAGTNSVAATEVPLLGGRPFWVYRRLLAPAAVGAWPAMLTAAFDSLAAGFDPDGDGPIGLCVLVDEEERRERPEAEWQDPRALYAGYAEDGRQVRVAYFAEAWIGRG